MKYLLAKIFFACLFCNGIFNSFSQSLSLTRGPYLQLPTSSGMIVRWRTNFSADSRVYYGTSPSSLSSFVDSAASTTEHAVHITGLSPYTKYFYAIGTTTQTLSGNDSLQYFITSPAAGAVQPVRIWAIGDFGKGNEGQRRVRDAYVNYTGSTHTDLWLWLGDNAYYNGTDSAYQANVFDSVNSYQKIMKHMPFMPCPGNHDYESVCPPNCNIPPTSHTGPYYDIINVPQNAEAGGIASGCELYYSYDYSNVHFISLNSEISSIVFGGYNWTGANPFSTFDTAASPMYQWLKADLQANNKLFTIVYFHQPPYTDGSHDASAAWELYMKAMRENFVPLLEQQGVDVVLCGHSHVYERSFLLKGHYGNKNSFDPSSMVKDGSSGKFSLGEPYVKDVAAPKAQNGTVYVVVGNSGSSETSPSLQYPAMYFDEGCDSCWGSVVIDVNNERLDARYLRADGEVADEFTILKPPPAGLDENSIFSSVKIFPNPFKNQTNIEYTLKKKTKVSIEMYDLSGKKVAMLAEGEQATGTHTQVLDAAKTGLGKGIYHLYIKGGENSRIEKILKVE